MDLLRGIQLLAYDYCYYLHRLDNFDNEQGQVLHRERAREQQCFANWVTGQGGMGEGSQGVVKLINKY